MRSSVCVLAMALALAACGPAEPPPPAANAPAAAKSPASTPDNKSASPAQTTAAPPATAAVPKEVPEGDCGDQSKLPEDQRIANTARWSTASEQDSFSFDVYRGDSEKG